MRGYLPRAVWRRLHPTGVWTLQAPDSSTFNYASDDDDIMARAVIWTNMRHWEETTHPVFYQLARDARGFVDVGAFAGIYTLLACRANPKLAAVAVEPNPTAARMLRRNIQINRIEDRVTVSSNALSDTPGRAYLAIPSDTTAASLLTPRTAYRTVEVDVTTGDALIGTRPVDLVKIDVEGLEPQVLRGMEQNIRMHYPSIIAECLDNSALNTLRQTVLDLGYRHIHHLSASGPVPATADLVPPLHYRNFLITRDSLTAMGL